MYGFIMLCSLNPLSSWASIHHSLDVAVHASAGEIEVTDRIQLPGAARFSLASGMTPSVEGGSLQSLGAGPEGMKDYLIVPDAEAPVVLHYSGGVSSGGVDIFDMPRAVVDGEGVFLDASSGWYPLFRTDAVTFDLAVTLPEGWTLVGQGRSQAVGEDRFRITVSQPQEDIYLLAGPYVSYAREHRERTIAVHLLQPDPELAERYLSAIGGYLDFYEKLIGPYAYKQFAVVENRWQTGYGMPGFTLLGARVLRLPFLLKTSLPHEILHNWFGNGVYIDATQGNWSEGLTAYLADYLIAEAQGEGAVSRLRLLSRYTDFAADGRDFPVADFRSRHNDASQAVGYDKVQLLIHMLRRQVGDTAFIEGVRRFYRDHRFQRADFMDFLGAFASESFDAEAFFSAWIERPGAPEIHLVDAAVMSVDGGYRLTLSLAQRHQGPAFPLRLPLYVTLEGEAEARHETLMLATGEGEFEFDYPSRPLRVDLDPAFETFRALLPLERPPTLGRLFGAPRQWLVVPEAAPDDVQAAWRELAEAWDGRYGNVTVIGDGQIDDVPEGDAVWLLGWANRGLEILGARFKGQGQRLDATGAAVDESAYDAFSHAVVMLDPDNARAPLGFVGAAEVTAIRRLAAKLTHYGSFGRMVFKLPGLENVRRDHLQLEHSPLTRLFTEQAPAEQLPAHQPLTEAVGVALP